MANSKFFTYRQSVFVLLLLLNILCTASTAQQSEHVFMFSYFKGNGEDGLHLASSKDGLVWEALNNDISILKPLVGNEKLMRDPCIIEGNDGYFHMVWTASWKDRGIGYARSKDLINWSEQQFIPVMQKEPAALNCWAPEISYNKQSGDYMIYWATTIPGRFPATDTSGDGTYNHRMYYVTTKNFETYSDTKLLYDKGFSVIDATIVPNGKGYMMVLKDETRKPPQKNLRVAFSDKLTGPYSAPSAPVTDTAYWAEGPTVGRLQDAWIVYFDKYTKHKMGAIRSADGKTWTDISEKIKFPEGTRHGTVFLVSAEKFNKLVLELQGK